MNVMNECVIEKYSIASPSMQREIKIVMVLPPAYATDSTKRFPILYALHGMDAPYDTWSEMAPLREALQEQPMIVVCFDADQASWYLDSPEKPESQFTTFFKELIPYLDEHYRVDASRRAVTGFSMGGFGAMHYALTAPTLFCSVSGLSGGFRHMDRSSREERRHERLTEVLGTCEEHPDRYDAVDLYVRSKAAVANGVRSPPVYQHCGTGDFLLDCNREFCSFLKDRGIACEYKESSGEHNWAFWKEASCGIADFHWRHFQG